MVVVGQLPNGSWLLVFSIILYFMEFFYWQNFPVPLKCVVSFLTRTNIAFANARQGYWAILVF